MGFKVLNFETHFLFCETIIKTTFLLFGTFFGTYIIIVSFKKS